MALIIEQKPLAEVTATISAKTPIGAKLRTSEWQRDVPAALRDQAFFSARVESARALAEAQAGLEKILNLSRDPNGALSMDRSKWIAEMQKLAGQLGLRATDPAKVGGLEDFGSERRLAEIYRQQIGQAQSKAYYLSGQDPDVLDAWPAQELTRIRASKVPREWHRRWADAGGKFFGGRMIALKTDPIWSKISRFDRPYPPFDFNSGMGLEEIDREEAEQLGLIKPGETIEPSVARDAADMQASVKGLPPEIREQLKKEFGNQIEVDGDFARWKPTSNPVDPTPKKADDNSIDGPSPQIAQEAAILAQAAGQGEDVPAGERPARRDPDEFRRIGQAAKESFGAVLPGYREGPESSPVDRAGNEGIEAQVAAAVSGTKPLFFEPFGPFSAPAAEALQPHLPSGAVALAEDGYLFVYRPEAVRPILDSDPTFYRPNGEDDAAAILRATAANANGELLGYGARQYSPTGGARVTIADGRGYTLIFFVSDPAKAEYYARERAADIAAYTGTEPTIVIDYQDPPP